MTTETVGLVVLILQPFILSRSNVLPNQLSIKPRVIRSDPTDVQVKAEWEQCSHEVFATIAANTAVNTIDLEIITCLLSRLCK
jgi:hypothetical protein